MKKIIKCFFLFLLIFFISDVNAKEINIDFFYGNGCPICSKEEKFLEEIEKKYDVKINKYETWYNEENAKLLDETKEKYNTTGRGVPYTVVEDNAFLGFNTTISSQIEDKIKELNNNTIKDDKTLHEDSKTIYDIPIIGKVDIKKVSVLLITIVIGLVDGFNPCAMWVLLFLISSLLGMKDRKRMWIIGVTFLLTSALVYMVIMLGWLEIVVNITTSILVRNIIACIAIIGGLVNLRTFIKTRNTSGCTILDDKKRTKVFDKIKNFTKEKSLFLALAGVITLAIGVNVVELACSAGLPLVFTQVLAINNITGVNALMYVFVYIFFFLIDDLLIFIIAMTTLKLTGISNKYAKYSHLVGGILMIVIGLLLIIKPELIMFNF